MENWKVISRAKCVPLSCGSGLYGCVVFDIDDEERRLTQPLTGGVG